MTNFNFAGIVLALLFFALIITKKNKQTRDYLLAFFIFLLGTYLLIKYVFENELYTSYPIIIYLDICYWVLLGPTLYVYTMVSTRGDNYLRIQYLYTLIPAFLVILFFSEYIFGNPLGLVSEDEYFPLYVIIGFIIWLYNSPIFYVLTIIALKKHQKNIKNHYSYSKSVDLRWLYYLSHGFAIFILFLVSKGITRILFDWEIPLDNYNISIFVVFVYIFGIGFYGYRQGGIFDNTVKYNYDFKKEQTPQKTNRPSNHQNGSYQKSGLNKEEALLVLNKLKGIMDSEQPYLESNLDLPSLANKVEISTHKLSQVINEYLNKNFFDFVNEYRVEKVKELLSDPSYNQFKIVSLAYDSGFSSKSTFYNLFKKIVRMTPADYRQKNQQKAG